MIIDIRDASKYAKGHLKDARNIPFFELYLHPDLYLDKKSTYYLYCDTGVKSKILVVYLNKQGYHCVNIEGGYVNHLFK
ncbi:MAG: rhodanese-like domain-containing protein [Bacilli bacterium]|nr:rhodanese-like domain-containing protein [Bacilli bacterium]